MSKGVDISKHNGNINFAALKGQIDFVILRGGYTGYGNATDKAKDSMFETYYSQCKVNGIPVGCYYFSIATNYQKGVEEANWLYENCLKGKQFEYPIYIDTEDDTGGRRWLRNAGKQNTTDGIKGFCETLEEKGYYVGIYASDISGFKDMMNIDQLKDYDKWVARYGSKPQYVQEYGMWQYTSSGRLSGCNTDIDMNECYIDYPSIMKSKGFNGYSNQDTQTIEPHPIKKSNDEIANEVINGMWGNGDDRKNLLSNAGYNYNEIQSIVNNKLGVNNQSSKIYYTVKNGDYLNKIARQFGVSVNQIVSLNGISNPDKIYAGQTLRIK